MRWLFERVVDRLIAKLTLLLAARFESHTELELIETKAEMLRRADELERDDSPEGKSLAAELRAAAARLGSRRTWTRRRCARRGRAIARRGTASVRRAADRLAAEIARPARARWAGEEVEQIQQQQAVLKGQEEPPCS